MDNAWNVQWVTADGVLTKKAFEGNSPKLSGAVDFAADLRKHGFSVEVISRRRAFPIPMKMAIPPQMGLLWCPYCIKWRDFQEAAVQHGDRVGPELLRCPVCTISVMDYYFRLYNSIFAERYFTAKEMQKNKNTEVPGGKRSRRIRVRRR